MLARDRKEAGEKIAGKLEKTGLKPDRVLAIASGGVVVGRNVANRAGADVEMMAVEDINAPEMPEVVVGSVTYDGTLALNDGVMSELGVRPEYIENARISAKREAERFFNLYSSRKEMDSLAGESVAIIDDGSTSNPGILAAAGHAKKRGAEKVCIAVPAVERKARKQFDQVADQLAVLEEVESRSDVSELYESSEWVSEKDLKRYIGD
jgi:predicted phosphoribosyltransferase